MIQSGNGNLHKIEFLRILRKCYILIRFDPSLPLTLTCDASAYGIGAVLARPDGSKKPIESASRTLNKAGKNYSQLAKEGCHAFLESNVSTHIYLDTHLN